MGSSFGVLHCFTRREAIHRGTSVEMVKLPSLREICVEELRLDDATQKRLRTDTKTFRTAWFTDNGGPDKVASNRELALRYLTDGNAAVGVKPGSLLWQTSGLDPNPLPNILPRDDEM